MLENQFLRFGYGLDWRCGLALPFRAGNNAEFYGFNEDGEPLPYATFVDPHGYEITGQTINGNNGLFNMPTPANVAVGECFRIALHDGKTYREDEQSEFLHKTNTDIRDPFLRVRAYVSEIEIDTEDRALDGISANLEALSISYGRTTPSVTRNIIIYAIVDGHVVQRSVEGARSGVQHDMPSIGFNIPKGQTSFKLIWTIVDASTGEAIDLGSDVSMTVTFGYFSYDEPLYSGLMKVVDDGTSHIRYKCYEDAFDFPFASGGWCALDLPFVVRHPQPTQDDSLYTTLSGRNIVLYSEVGKEYECETDYIPEEWHDKLAIALACDEVYVDGKLLSKSDKYQIGWDEKDVTECGVELAKATFKMKENIVKRNSNY